MQRKEVMVTNGSVSQKKVFLYEITAHVCDNGKYLSEGIKA